ncbi:PSD1 and planctomycete cytochrome C domain-containing protein [Rhodopirellula sp. P2]|uniref:PSD1 and planctomycete cytochrome C domain-containing protein n=1 Tax=Rhodopirellula sp. P2 TaxID=2127060 RepID=UPI0023684E00|nr:PSD1 and planctomycete cytochrome C domain-containing protein [Rhodopirellula sp. P2]WDQ19077.1 PSD1 and planctomycete cytochrome C domain-containing protein [Rhodopirellula sp. P2]
MNAICGPALMLAESTSALLQPAKWMARMVGFAVAGSFLLSLPAQAEVDYAKEIKPLLAKRCYSCHGPDQAESGLGLHQAETSFVEGDSGERLIVPGDPESSHLLERIVANDDYELMPPEGEPLSEAEVERIRLWIKEGATFTKHWAYEPVQDVSPPSMSDAIQNLLAQATSNDQAVQIDPVVEAWQQSNHPVDAFLLDSLLAAGLTPNAPADRHTLIRRVTFDLTGLPPTQQEVAEFVHNSDPKAYENLVERLLRSPHYGERWGRHWLDLVRYAETNSFERDNPKPNAWKYRDYVIRSFNEDKPYDQFVREQLAGDLQAEVTTESLTATGYFRLGIWDDEPADPLQARYDELDDLVTVTGQTFLGLTINCARCHDHKIDPIPQTDYYGMLAFFADISRYGTRSDQVSNNQIDVSAPGLNEAYAKLDDQQRKLRAEATQIEQDGITKMSAPDQRATEGPKRQRDRILKKKLRPLLTQEQRKRYDQIQSELGLIAKQRNELPDREQVLGLGKLRPIEETFLLFRGNPHSPTDSVTPRFPEVFQESPPEMTPQERRRVFAEWVTSPENRLSSRVMANRIWQHHFGRGIVRSPNNFGGLGVPPTHPELLDYLANRLVDGDWKLKDMHRLICTSQAYQMSSEIKEASAAIDPGNDLFWKFDARRLSAEEVRDSILAVNESLNRESYGPSFYPTLSAEVMAGQSKPGQGWGNSSEAERNRRSVYIHVKRSLLSPLLSAFDFPEPDTTCEARFATLQPGQAMSLLNSDFIHEEADKLAKSVHARLPGQSNAQSFVAAVIEQVLMRPALDVEIEEGVELIDELITKYEVGPDRANALYALSVLNWNEFVFVF